MGKAKYSFLLPAYKATFFEQALLSIKSQTYIDFKVLVSDDCSPEDLKSVFDKVVGDDPRFEFRRNEVNMGSKSLVSHWNLLVDMCDTEYLVMASDDDLYLPNFLEDIDKLTCKFSNVNLFRGRSRNINEKGQFRFEEEIMPEWMDNLHFIHRIYQKDWTGGIASFVYKTEILKKIGIFVDFPAAWFSDEVTNFLMAENGCCFTRNVAFDVRSSSLQISGQWGNPDDSRKKVNATLMNHKWMSSYMLKFSSYKDKELLNIVTKECYDKIIRNIHNYIYSCYMNDFFKFLIRCPNDMKLDKIRMIAHFFRAKLAV